MSKVIHLYFRLAILFLLGLLIVLNITPVLATGTVPQVNWIAGPKNISMGDNLATLNLPSEYLFANAEDTSKLMEYMGNSSSNQDIGLVRPNASQKDWFVVFSYNPMGYVKDDESKSIDKDAILESIKAGTEQENKQRQDKGIAPITVTGWQEEPHYDTASHNLVWAIAAMSDNEALVNYNTRKLGRSGVTSINLVASPASLATVKPELENLVANYTYVPGKQYSDFVQGTDKVAELGLTALIAGGVGAAAVKTGVLAKILLFLGVALKKVFVFLIVGVGALLKKLFGGGRKSQDKAEK